MLMHNLSLLLSPDAATGTGGGGEGAATPSGSTTSGASGDGGAGASPAAVSTPASDSIASAMQRAREGTAGGQVEILPPGASIEGDEPAALDAPAAAKGDDVEPSAGSEPEPVDAPEGGELDLISDEHLAELLGGAHAHQAQTTQAAAPAAPQPAQTAAAPAQPQQAAQPAAAPAAPVAPAQPTAITIPEVSEEKLKGFIDSVGADEAKPVLETIKGVTDAAKALVTQNTALQQQNADLVKRLDAIEADRKQEREQAQTAAQVRGVERFVSEISAIPGYEALKVPKIDPTQPIRMGPNGPEGGGLSSEEWAKLKAVDLLAAKLFAEADRKGSKITEAQAAEGAIRTITRSKPASKAPAQQPTTQAAVVQKLRSQAATRSPAAMSRGNTRLNGPAYSDNDDPVTAVGKTMAKVRAQAG